MIIMKFKTMMPLAAAALLGLAPGYAGAADTLYTTTVTKDKPVVYWNFDEADGNALQKMPLSARPITTENDLVPSGTVTRFNHATQGSGLRLGNAANFTAPSWFRANETRTGKTALEGAYAIELWFQSQGANAKTYLLNFGPVGADSSPAVIYNYNTEYLELYGGGRTGVNGPTMSDQAWHHLVFVYYGNGSEGVAARVDAFLDGAAYPYIGDGMSVRLSLPSIMVGAALTNGDNAWTGRIDEVAIYDLSSLADETAVSDKVNAMVGSHMASASATSGTPYSEVVLADQPFLYWNFDEADGNARQLAPVATPADPDNSRNELVPTVNAVRASHSGLGSGLLLGNALDLDGLSSFQIENGLDTGIPALKGPWALEMWAQLTADQANRYLINLGGGGRNSPAIIYGYFGPRLEVFGNGRSTTNGVPLTDRKWHHILVANYNTAPGTWEPGEVVNRIDFFIDNVQYKNVGGGFNQPLDFTGWLMFGTDDPRNLGSMVGRLDELAIYNLDGLASVEAVESKVAALASTHYAAAFGSTEGVVTVTSEPEDATSQLGATVAFSVAATSAGTTSPLIYQWLRNGEAIEGATNATYTTPVLSLYDLGTNTYSARVSAGAAFKFSRAAALVVAIPAPGPVTPYAQQVQKDSPLLYWNFDEMTGPALQQMAVSAKPLTTENDLVPTSSGVTRASHADLGDGLGKLGNAVVLDGTGHLMANTMRLAKNVIDGPWAAEFWMRLDNEIGTGFKAYIANFGNVGVDNAPAFIYGFNADRLELFAGGNGRSGANGPTVADNNWHHVIWVNYNTAGPNANNRVEAYIDGVLQTNVGGGFSKSISLTHLIFGAATETADHFLGALDELAVYDLTGLAAEEIATRTQNMAANHGTAARQAGGSTYAAAVLADQPVLYYSFDEADGNALQKAPVTLPTPNADKNHMIASSAGRVQHSVQGDNLYLGNAADFGGKGYYQTAQLDTGRGQLDAPWAVEFWMKVQGPNLTERQNFLLNFGNNAPAFLYDYLPDQLEIYTSETTRTGNGPVVVDDTWHHVLWVYYGDGATGVADRADAYLDGVQYPYARGTFARALNLEGSLVVGAARPGYNMFQGCLDEVALYDLSALSTEAAIEARVQQMVTTHRAAALQAPAQPVSLQFSRSGNVLTLSWTGSGCQLEQNDNAANPSGWSNVSGGTSSPVVITVPSTGAKFYRLKK